MLPHVEHLVEIWNNFRPSTEWMDWSSPLQISDWEGDEGAIVHSVLIQDTPVKFSLVVLIMAMPCKMRQQFQYLLTQSNPNFVIPLASAEMRWPQSSADGEQWPFLTQAQKPCDSQNRPENG